MATLNESLPPKGHIEPLSGVLRLGGAYGEPFHFTLTLRYIAPDRVEVLGALGHITPSIWKGVQDVLKAHGIGSFYYIRFKNGQPVIHLHSTSRLDYD